MPRARPAVSPRLGVALTRPTRADEREFLERVAQSVSVHRPWVPPPSSPEAFAAYLRRVRRPDGAGFLVRDTTSDAICGVVNLNNIIRGALQSAFLGYYAFAGGGGRGLMTEGVRLTCEYAFRELNLHRLEASIQPGNARSLALARRCGFRQEGFSPRYLQVDGVWQDHERWALTVEDVPGR